MSDKQALLHLIGQISEGDASLVTNLITNLMSHQSSLYHELSNPPNLIPPLH